MSSVSTTATESVSNGVEGGQVSPNTSEGSDCTFSSLNSEDISLGFESPEEIEKLNRMIFLLGSLLPGLPRVDEETILNCAIETICKLKHDIRALEQELTICNETSGPVNPDETVHANFFENQK
ncbi:hypothetical protein MPTK1_2g22510 [Marchantia polymorpha subsp. ruderalis]|uniref:BHLH domain-containing protein n=1 Tax=Marchantia polymorpha TaxID=3197 RepID=A0A2R6WNA7_MARPO|nr:hypothetical protein MARPO_0072s0080 [Marchantia polymorpha]BBN03312.1 hypothetical protein Mp_2g22510 [Marchantia polymorpha subsp. ruderalis]|eukprot:PTQ35339.1 hypothetical protein MARPO_0072s0080 [Marchantia polymorpha]